MIFLDKYYEEIKKYYGIDEIKTGTNILKREPLRMLLLMIDSEEGINPNAVIEYFKIKVCRGGSYANLNAAKLCFEMDKSFKRRYNEILKLVKDGAD